MHSTLCGFSCLQEELEETVTDDGIKPQFVAPDCDRSVGRADKVGFCVYGTNLFFIAEI